MARWTVGRLIVWRRPATRTLADMRARIDDLLEPDADDLERELIGRLFASFVQRLPGALDAVAEALRTGDTTAVITEAHRLKGMASNVGARRLTGAAAAIEDASRSGVLPAGVERALRREAELAARMADRLAPHFASAPSAA